MINIGRYKTIANTNDFKSYKISAIIPEPDEKDYKRGYIKRYFVQTANDSESHIYEISENLFGRLNEDPLYLCVSLKWRLIGTVEQVKESNFKSVKFASQTMKQITFYLPYYLQFYKW
jgi:hypothetical protein